MSVMSPRLVLCTIGDDGFPQLPTSVVIGGYNVTIHDGSPDDFYIVDKPAREYRSPDTSRVVVLSPFTACALPDTRNGAATVAWVPAQTPEGDNPVYDVVAEALHAQGLIVKSWPVEYDSDGQFVIASLEADTSAEGMCVKSNWPTRWRKYNGTENPGDYEVDPPIEADPPAGDRIIGAVLA